MRTQRISHRDAGQNRTPAVPKRRFTAAPACALAVALSAATICPPTAIAQQAILASPRNTVIPPTEFAAHPAISADGRQVAFTIQDVSISPFATPESQIYIFNRKTGQLAIASSSNGLPTGLGTSASRNPAISANGRFVAFRSLAQLGVPTFTGTGIFILDRDADNDGILDELGTGRKLLIGSTSSTATNFNQFSDSDQPSFSASGRFLTFISKQASLVPGGVNTGYDVYVKDRDLDADGIFDEFAAGAHKTVRVSVSSAGQPANNISNAANPVISADGRFVAYESDANNLVADDTNGFRDVFLHDRDADADNIFDEPGSISTIRVSVAADGAQADGPSHDPAISADGRYVAFVSTASTLVPGLPRRAFPQIYLFDRVTNEIQLISRTLAGDPSPTYCLSPSLNSDGSILAFSSSAMNLISIPVTGTFSVFIWKRGDPLNGISLATSNLPSEFGLTEPILAQDGRFLATTSMSRDLGADGDPAGRDAFVIDVTPCVPDIFLAPSNSSACVGSNVTFSVTVLNHGPFQYQWLHDSLPIPGATAPTLTIQNAQVADSGAYSVQAMSQCATVTTDAATILVGTAPTITSQPASARICVNATTTLRVTATGQSPLQYQWFRDGLSIQGATASQYTATASYGPRIYKVVVTGPCGTITSENATVEGEYEPQITHPPATQLLCLGDEAHLEVEVIGVEPISYQWYFNYSPIPNANQSQLIIPDLSMADFGDYKVTVTDACGSSSAEAGIYVARRPTITSSPVSRTVCAGTPVTFTVTATGSGALTYQWFRNQSPIPGATSASLVLASPTTADSGAYFARVTDGCSSRDSNSANLTVNPFSPFCAAWAQRSPSTPPAARTRHGMVYDPARHLTVMFGGVTASPDDATWIWDGTSWQSLTPVTRPVQRSAFGMTYDSARQRAIVFGGQARDGTLLNDFWSWDGSSWSVNSPGGEVPQARTGTAIAYDSIRDRIVLFGGLSALGEALGDTWEWDGTAWQQKAPSLNPNPRFDHAMAFDPVRAAVVMQGGSDNTTDTWEYDGTNWSRRTQFPAGFRRRHSMTFVDLQPGVWLYGNSASADTRIFTLSAVGWLSVNPVGLAPAARWGTGFVFDSDRVAFVLFGGTMYSTNASLNDTWEFVRP